MKRLYTLSALVLLGPFLSVGCSGGHDSCCSSSSKAVARQRAIVTMRITRATLAVAGFARRQTRAAGVHMGNRIGIWMNAVRHVRSVSTPSTPTTPTLDADTGLYYTLTVNPDGSGQQNLFVDSAAQTPAGAFTFTATQWTGDQPGNYPATFNTVYQITAGNFAGEHGTIAIKSDDATGDNGTMTIDLTDAQKEHCVSDFTITNGVLKAKAHCTLADNSSYDSIYDLIGDVITCSTTYPDGGTQEISVNSDGSASEIIENSDGQSEATGTIDPEGNDTIEYDDGSSEIVDVDTGDNWDDGSDGTSTEESVKRRTKRATNLPPRIIPRKR
ncbi:MAG: hypothetical protein JWN14_2325 [Chthonomonadales bacterium]|nr:hypothetical protein [Chthonomonadales bacterium]